MGRRGAGVGAAELVGTSPARGLGPPAGKKKPPLQPGAGAGGLGLDWCCQDFPHPPCQQARRYAFKCHRTNEPTAGGDVIYPVNALAFHPTLGTFATGGEAPGELQPGALLRVDGPAACSAQTLPVTLGRSVGPDHMASPSHPPAPARPLIHLQPLPYVPEQNKFEQAGMGACACGTAPTRNGCSKRPASPPPSLRWLSMPLARPWPSLQATPLKRCVCVCVVEWAWLGGVRGRFFDPGLLGWAGGAGPVACTRRKGG